MGDEQVGCTARGFRHRRGRAFAFRPSSLRPKRGRHADPRHTGKEGDEGERVLANFLGD